MQHAKFGGFNSTMVRLKLDKLKFCAILYIGFNSTMVRLKLREQWNLDIENMVSIPQWFD